MRLIALITSFSVTIAVPAAAAAAAGSRVDWLALRVSRTALLLSALVAGSDDMLAQYLAITVAINLGSAVVLPLDGLVRAGIVRHS
jgi:hypothetical protein